MTDPSSQPYTMQETIVTLEAGQLEAVRPSLKQGCTHNLQALIALARETIELESIVLIEHPPEHYFEGENPSYPRLSQYFSSSALADSIGECASLPITPYQDPIGDVEHILFPCLYGRVAQIRRVASWLPQDMQSRVWSALRISRSFERYKSLWTGQDNSESMTETIIRAAEESAGLDAYSIGRGLAAVHSSCCLHADAHRRNFVPDGWERARILDLKTFRVLYRPPTPAECATDVGPLMDYFSPQEWRQFRFGYLHECKMHDKVDGRLVLGLIEYGREAAWTRFGPLDRLDTSLKNIDAEIATEQDPKRRLVLLIRRMTLLISMVSSSGLTGEIMSLLTNTAEVLPEHFLVALVNFAESCLQIGDRGSAQMFLNMAVSSASQTIADQIAANVAAGILSSIEPPPHTHPSI